MRRLTTFRLVPAALAVLFGGQPSRGQEPARPAPEVIAQWKEAGASVGWLSEEEGRRHWYTVFDRPPAGAIPAFQLTAFPTGKMALPAPEVPFGLSLKSARLSNTDMKELARVTRLRILYLS